MSMSLLPSATAYATLESRRPGWIQWGGDGLVPAFCRDHAVPPCARREQRNEACRHVELGYFERVQTTLDLDRVRFSTFIIRAVAATTDSTEANQNHRHERFHLGLFGGNECAVGTEGPETR
jgi:hypothetical protein